MEKETEKGSIRIKFPPEAVEELDSIRERLKVESKVDVVKIALFLLDFCIEQLEKGNRICVLNENEIIAEIKLPK